MSTALVTPGRPDPDPTPGVTGANDARACYTPPRLEALGSWSALTLQQSVPIGPGDVLWWFS